MRRRRAARTAPGIVAVACMLSSAQVRARLGPEPEPLVSDRDDTIATLHRQGDALFEQDDYNGAREAWMGALRLVDDGDASVAYRVSLVSLIVSAAIAEFSSSGDAAVLQEAMKLVDTARADPALDAALVETLDYAQQRLTPLLDPVPAPEPVVSPPVVQGTVTLGEGKVETQSVELGLPLILGGSIAAVGGIAAIIAGTTFKPRAIRMVEGEGQTVGEALEFVNPEIRKGQGWIGAGVAVTALGLGALITGVVLRRRSGRLRAGVDGDLSAGRVVLRGSF